MSYPANYTINLHQTSLTIVWCIILSVSIVTATFRYDKVAAITHMVFGWIIFAYSFIFTLILLVPFGFNQHAGGDWIYFAHAVVGTALLGIVTVQVTLGMLSRTLQHRADIDIKKIFVIRAIHRYLGYLMYLTYNTQLLIAWYPGSGFVGFAVWDGFWILVWIFIKVFTPRMQKRVIDSQTADYIVPSVGSLSEVKKVTENFIVYANYVYDARNFEKYHPGGSRVIKMVKGREVDRFLYGMYSVELYPQLPPHSHSGNALQKIGKPIAKLVTPPTYSSMKYEVNEGVIKYMNCVSNKTQIYSLGIVQETLPLVFLGYSDIRQLGQFYSFTIQEKVTRLYTAVNFLSLSNIRIMDELLNPSRQSEMKKYMPPRQTQKSIVETELPKLVNPIAGTQNKEPLMNNFEKSSGQYFPIMMKVYQDGKLTSALKEYNFVNVPVKFSSPRGRGLELDSTKPGRIVVMAGGTGLFPFSDTIDLLYKDYLIKKKHKMSKEFLRNDPILEQKPFDKNTFVFLIAVNEPEDIHPITFGQLSKLSEQEDKIKIVLRVSRNAEQLRGTGKIQFTREYFNKRVIDEASVKNLSRVWVCGPPRMTSETGQILVQSGYTNKEFLFV